MFRDFLTKAVLLLLAGVGSLASAQTIIPEEPEGKPMPQMIVNARWAFVTGLRGDEFSDLTLLRDREAIVQVRNALREWNRYRLTQRAQDAEIIIVVRRGNVDVMDVYFGRLGQQGSPLWTAAQSGGLDPPELSLVEQFKKEVEAAAARNKESESKKRKK